MNTVASVIAKLPDLMGLYRRTIDWYSTTGVVLSLSNQDVFGVLNGVT